MNKDEVVAMAAREGSEDGPLGQWPGVRLDQRPNAGDVVQVGGHWYVAVAGVSREGYRGNYGGLYARWVQVPESECEGW